MSHTSPTSPSPTFEYRHTAVWTPLGGLVATGFLLGCAITAKSVGQAILLLLATGVFGWAATLFYEAEWLEAQGIPVRKDSGLLTEGPAGDEVRVVI